MFRLFRWFRSYRHRRCYHLGTIFLEQEQWQKAESLFRRAAGYGPDDPWSHNNLAIALLKLGRFEESCAEFLRAIQLRPDFAESRENLGAALTKLYRWEEAVAVYRGALVLDPKRLDSARNLGIALSRLQRWSDAAVAFQDAINLDPTDPVLCRNLGVAHLREENWEAAATAYRRSITLDPNNSDAYCDFATALTRCSFSDEAREGYRKMLALAPDNLVARVGLAVELLKLGQWDEAVTVLQGKSRLGAAEACCNFLQVDPLCRLGRFGEAAEAHRRAVKVGGSMPLLPGEPVASRFAQRQGMFWSRENLISQVFSLEKWLEEMAAPPRAAGPDPGRTGQYLFVLDNDYGELTTLMYFVLGQPLSRQAKLLLPERLIANNPDALPERTCRFDSMNEILRVVDADQPEIVFLCSAYLFSYHNLISFEELQGLVGALRERGCRVVTTDPFLSMLSREDPATLISIDIPEESNEVDLEKMRKGKEIDDKRLRFEFSRCERLLRNIPHLYPAFCGACSKQRANRIDARSFSFFNHELIRPELEWGTEADERSIRKPHWLFLLSQVDYETQLRFEGSRFFDILASKLVDTLAVGRHPILIAPDEVVRRVISRMPTVDGVDIISFCPFRRLMSLLLSAEYSFYWNAVSHTILIRLFNRRPVILFDRGHLIRNMPAIYERVVKWYYQGWEPKFGDHREVLTLATTSEWTSGYRLAADRIVEGFRRAPAPTEMIAALLTGHAPGATDLARRE